MKKFFLFIAACCLASASVLADKVDETKQQINRIKKNQQYIYAEITAPSPQEARAMSEEMLHERINEWAAKQRKLRNSPQLVVNNRRELWTSLELPRGNMFRAFLYVKKSDILPAENAEVLKPSESTVEAIKSAVQTMSELPDVVLEIAKCKKYADMAAMVMNMKRQGRISEYGRMPLPNAEEFYLAVYNRNGDVVALLTPGTNRLNVATGKADSVDNYKNENEKLGAIAFKVTK